MLPGKHKNIAIGERFDIMMLKMIIAIIMVFPDNCSIPGDFLKSTAGFAATADYPNRTQQVTIFT